MVRGWAVVLAVLGLGGAAVAVPVDLRVEHRALPLGVDVPRPVLSWRSDDAARDWRQVAYRVTVASTPELLAEGRPDLWDSGRMVSGESVGVVYGGRKLDSGRRYFWAVETWDAAGVVERSGVAAGAGAGAAAWWETGLLEPEDWSAQWVGRGDAEQRAVLARVGWMWVPGVDARAVPARQTARFRYALQLDAVPEAAVLHVLTGGNFVARVNGVETGHKQEWGSFDREDVRGLLRVGANEIEIEAVSRGGVTPDAVAAVLALRKAGGQRQEIVSDGSWRVRTADGREQAVALVPGGLGALRVSVGSDRRTLMEAPERYESEVSLLRRSFAVRGEVRSARLYVTAMGAYRAYVNGERVGESELAPGFTDFRKRVQYQTYDVTGLVRRGENVVGAELGPGWHGSPLLWSGVREFGGPELLRAQLVLTMEDGSQQTVGTDGQWTAAASATDSAEIYGGESYDARLARVGWAAPGGGSGGVRGRRKKAVAAWPAVMVGSVGPEVRVTAQPDASIEARQEIVPVSSKVVPGVGGEPAATVYDLGQNMVGVARLRVRGVRGQTVRLRFAERLNPDGGIYTENLRDADATDTYTLAGGGEEVWTPAFTYHGFRYVELAVTSGGAAPVSAGVTGVVWNSLPQAPAMQFHSSSALLNRMYELGLWGQRGNFVSVPTDCPQRDERLGWMGDAGVFWRTGTYNFDIDPFTQKYMDDVRDAQTADGRFTNIAPNLLLVGPEGTGAPGWGDAGVLVPYATWLQYGDRALLERSWPAMTRWMAFIERTNPAFVRENDLGPNYGDWLAPDPKTPQDLVGTAYWALVARQMREMALALDKTEDAGRYERLYGQIRAAYRARYVRAGGMVEGDTQTAYVLTLYAGLADEGERRAMTDRLVANIAAHGEHLSTGFLGTPFLLFVLDHAGRSDVAFRLLLTETYPSWGYMVSKGATTWWERWNGDTGDPGMNSYNHYAFGSVMAWVYRRVSGIDTDATGAGFHHLLIAPHADAGLSEATSEYASAYGPVRTAWTREASGGMRLELLLPANTSATVTMPAVGAGELLRDGVVVPARRGAEGLSVEVGAGRSVFESR